MSDKQNNNFPKNDNPIIENTDNQNIEKSLAQNEDFSSIENFDNSEYEYPPFESYQDYMPFYDEGMTDIDSPPLGQFENTAAKVEQERAKSEIDQMRAQVEERKNAELQEIQNRAAKNTNSHNDNSIEQASDGPSDPSKPKKFKREFILQCCRDKDKGNGILFSHLFNKKYACLGERFWLEFENHAWQDIDISKVYHAVECVADEYNRLCRTIYSEMQQAEKEENKELASKLSNQVKGLKTSINRLHTISGVRDCLEFSKANKLSTMIDGSNLNSDPYILCCQNGIVDIRTGFLRDGFPDDFITKKCGSDWKGLDEKAPTWEKMVHQILGEDEEVTHYFQKLIGMAVCGEISEKIFIVLLGEDGDSGKTTIFEILFEILKSYISPMPVEMLLDQRNPKNPDSPTPSIMSLKGKRICWASEPGENRRFSIENIKLMSGNDSLTGRNPWDKDMSSFIPTHTLFLLTNHKMRASAHDQAFWSRLRLIDCPFNFVAKPDPNNPKHKQRVEGLQKKVVQDEASGVLAWIVRGYMLYLTEGIEPPEKVQQATSQYRREEDIMAEFVEQCLVVDVDSKIGGSELYDIYKNWFIENYSKNVMSGTFFGRMAAKQIQKRKVGGKVQYLGYKITDEAVKNYANK